MSKVFLFLSILLLRPPAAIAQDLAALNAGFVSGVWYSKTPFFAGEQVRIYSAIQNQSSFDLIGNIQFFDGEKLIGQSDFSVINGRLIEKWMDWQVTVGEHEIYVALTDTKKTEVGKEPVPVTLANAISQVDKRFVDIDTDGDQTGNRQDADDDNDGISDEQELAQGSDPLEPDPKPTDELSASQPEQEQWTKLTETAGSVLEKLDELAVWQKVKVDERRSQIRGEREAGGQATTTTQLKQAGLSALSFVLGSKILFYSTILLSLYLLWKLFRLWRRR